jgi:hypothetical protein
MKLAEQLDMKVLLYDEGMYPSGSANGQVVKKHPEFASKGIYISKIDEFIKKSNCFQKELGYFNWNECEEKATFVENKNDAEYVLVHEDSMGSIRGIHFGEDDGEPNAPRSTDLLNTSACKFFIKLTHEVYYQQLKEFFGSTIIGFFTDEPSILGRKHRKNMLPYNDELADILSAENIEIEDLPILFLGNNKRLNENYQKCVNLKLAKSFYQPISTWCSNHNIFLTGHPQSAHDIGLLKYFQLPGQDVVWRWVAPENDLGIKGKESVTAKCSADAARHAGNKRNLSECFGCCGPKKSQWAFSTDDMKWYLDWLFTRGVNFIVPHAFFYSIDGKRAEDRPPDVGLNNLWWDDYQFFSDYIKRMSYMMSDQINMTNIAVLAEKNRLPFDEIDSLIKNQIDFNYLEDTYIFRDKYSIEDNFIKISNQKYNVLIIDKSYHFAEKIKNKLRTFIENGGTIIELTAEKNFSYYKNMIRTFYNTTVRISGNTLEEIRYSEFIKKNETFYLLNNEGEQNVNLTVIFKEQISGIEIWDAWEGYINYFKVENQQIEISIPRRTLIIIHKKVEEHSQQTTTSIQQTISKELPYHIEANRANITSVGSWTNQKKLIDFSGTITYELHFDNIESIKQTSDEYVFLNLGDVKNIASLIIDDIKIDTKFWAPYRFKLTKIELTKKIRIDVTNTLANRKDHVPLSSGLIGPITIEYYV